MLSPLPQLVDLIIVLSRTFKLNQDHVPASDLRLPQVTSVRKLYIHLENSHYSINSHTDLFDYFPLHRVFSQLHALYIKYSNFECNTCSYVYSSNKNIYWRRYIKKRTACIRNLVAPFLPHLSQLQTCRVWEGPEWEKSGSEKEVWNPLEM